ncbi:ACS family tartrate transporter-like MFS transporter [Pseudomonas lini]|uniref:MFS transporter n=1 Tax=Pseudomonas lini TaxID=163011 RepID=UPI002780614F|nr:MFS transporter [Pseudomonas lini]MDQ0126817.1 ACS family tartrate transporter-like MFS transporter [Pseudomonas lini]
MSLEKQVMRKVSRRLVPLLMILYFVAYVDRINLGFAGLTMNKDLGFSPQVFGLGAAFFFVGYLILQIPGNLLIHKMGARRLTAAMAFAWGVFAVGMAFVWDANSFYAARFLLGAAESAFAPGMIFYISLWFPKQYRGRVLTLFILANPLAGVIGLPLSALLMQLHGVANLTGWQWIFIGEGFPAILLAFVAWRVLTDRPTDAKWLNDTEREWLVNAMEHDVAARKSLGFSKGRARRHAVLLAVIYFGIIMGLYGFGLWLPQIVKSFGASTFETGFISAIPYVGAALFMLFWGRRLDRKGNAGWHTAMACFLGCVGLVATAFASTGPIAVAMLTIAAMGLFAGLSTFWTTPTNLYAGSAAAASIGFIASIGHFGGFTGPYVMGLMLAATNSHAMGLCALAGALGLAGLLIWQYRDRGQSETHGPAVASASKQ